MNLIDINVLPTCVTEIPRGSTGVHESTLRAYHILQKAKELLSLGTPSGVVLDLISEMEALRPVERSAESVAPKAPLPSVTFLRDQAEKALVKANDLATSSVSANYWIGREEAFRIAADVVEHYSNTGELP